MPVSGAWRSRRRTIVADNIPMNRLTPEERYQRDLVFRLLVDVLTQAIRRGDYTPTEMLEAATLVCVRHERCHATADLQREGLTPKGAGR